MPPPPPLPALAAGAATLMVTLCAICSLLTPQSNSYVNVPLVVAVCVTDPDVGCAPAHGVPFAPPPLPVQLVAPVVFHDKVKELPVLSEEALLRKLSDSAAIESCAWVETAGVDGSML